MGKKQPDYRPKVTGTSSPNYHNRPAPLANLEFLFVHAGDASVPLGPRRTVADVDKVPEKQAVRCLYNIVPALIVSW